MPSSECRSCGQPIIWVKMKKSGKAMPCDPKIVTIFNDQGQSFTGRLSHFGTCPEAKEWSRK